MISASACGKFILLGEHSVVHQRTAIAFPLLDKQLSYSEITSRTVTSFTVTGEVMREENIQKLLELRERLTGLRSSEFHDSIEIKTQIPIGSGLGSSAALCTSLLRAHGVKEGLELAEKAYYGEELFHGRASGVDPYTIAIEKIINFNSNPRSYLPLSENPIAESELAFLLLDSGTHHQTKEVLKQSDELKQKNEKYWSQIIKNLSELSLEGLNLWSSNFSEIGKLMTQAHKLLQELGVSNESLDSLVEEALRAGAIGAKLTGAGRGGYIVALVPAHKINKLVNEVFPKVKSMVWKPKESNL